MPSLSIGSSGPQVRQVQRALSEGGFLSGPIDGKFGAVTANAVESFQRSENLQADGKVGPQTQQALQRRFGDVFDGAAVATSAPLRGIAGFSAQQLGYVREMAAQAKAVGVPAELPVMTALVETRLQNLPHGDRDSIGLFQQRNAWGSRADRLNPAKATELFLNGGRAGQRGALAFQSQFGHLPATAHNLGRWAQAVQVSAFPDRYAQQFHEARRLLSAAGVA